MVLMPLLSRLLTLLVILTMPLFLARLTLIPIKSLSICLDRKSGSAGMPRPNSYAVFCLKKKTEAADLRGRDVDVVRARQIIGVGRAQESEAVGEHLDDAL